jgi:hypothetical protein
MDNDDDLVFLYQGEDEEYSVYQTQDQYEDQTDLETTIRITQKRTPYWQRTFG